MTTHAELERRGRVDAVIRLTLSRRFGAHITAEDWCDVLDVTPGEVRAELTRRRDVAKKRLKVLPGGLRSDGKRPGQATGRNPKTCATCGETFLDGRALAGHLRAHRPKVPCPVCGTPVTPPNGLTRHLRQTHPDHRPEETSTR